MTKKTAQLKREDKDSTVFASLAAVVVAAACHREGPLRARQRRVRAYCRRRRWLLRLVEVLMVEASAAAVLVVSVS